MSVFDNVCMCVLFHSFAPVVVLQLLLPFL